jgi:hypothetical protein
MLSLIQVTGIAYLPGRDKTCFLSFISRYYTRFVPSQRLHLITVDLYA